MATAAEPNDQDCSICHELFTNPKILRCGHLLCELCLLDWVKSQKDAQCPLCRCTIVHPHDQGQKSPEDIVKQYLTDLAMKRRVDAERIIRKDHNCCVCSHVIATSMCLTCQDMFCKSCTKVHQKQSLSKHHKIETLSSLTADKVVAGSPSVCHIHSDRASEVFCSSHQVAICSTCAIVDHRQCTVTRLESKMEEARAVLQELAATLMEGETTMEKAMKELDQQVQESEKRTKDAIQEIEKICDRLDDLVKKCRHYLKELAHQSNSDTQKSARDGKACFFNRKGMMTTHRQAVERTSDLTDHSDLTEMTSVMETCVNNLDRSTTLPPDIQITTATVVINKKAVACLEKCLTELGDVQSVPFTLSFHTSAGPTRSNTAATAAATTGSTGTALSNTAATAAATGTATTGTTGTAISNTAATGTTGTAHSNTGGAAARSLIAASHPGQVPQFTFHRNHGKDIQLSNNRQTAQRMRERLFGGHGIVMGSEPMETSCLYQVEIQDYQGRPGKCPLSTGVVVSCPDQLDLPYLPWRWTSAVVVGIDSVNVCGNQTRSSVGKKLKGLTGGSRVGVSLDRDMNLLVHVDGVSQGVASRAVPQPAFPLFDLWRSYKVTALPVTRLQ